MRKQNQQARIYIVHGRVQGVGYRDFARRAAETLGLRGWARNLEDGTVEVFAQGPAERLAELARYLRQGPRLADVRHLEEQEAPLSDGLAGFSIR